MIELRKSITEAENKIENRITKRVPPFINIQQAGALLQRAGFTSPVIDRDSFVSKFQNVNSLMQTIRKIGETNILSERKSNFTRKETFLELEKIYKRNFGSSANEINATIEILNVTAW